MFSFPRYYCQAFEQQDDFEIEVPLDGAVNNYLIKAVSALDGL